MRKEIVTRASIVGASVITVSIYTTATVAMHEVALLEYHIKYLGQVCSTVHGSNTPAFNHNETACFCFVTLFF
jgi:hypothetical protein